jgi:cold shock CspA family protein
MPTLLIATASALLLAALVTEATSRFWPDNYLALLVIAFIALLINGLFNARLKQSSAPAQAARQSNRQRDSKPDAASQRKKDNRGQRDNREKSAKQKPARDKQEENAPRGPQETGSVKWFNRSKGYGFIIRENGEEIFVHQRSIVSQGDRNQRPILHDGQKVSFVVAHLDKGAQAEEVSGLD